MSIWSNNWMSNFLKHKFWILLSIFFDKIVPALINIIQHEQYFFVSGTCFCYLLVPLKILPHHAWVSNLIFRLTINAIDATPQWIFGKWFIKTSKKKKRKKIHFTINISMYTSNILKFYELLFCTYCKGLLCLKKQSLSLYSSTYTQNTPNIRKWERPIAI